MLTSRERVKMAFNFEEPDRVPVFEQDIAANVASEILGRRALGGCGNGYREIAEMLYRGERDILVKRLCLDTVELHTKLDLDIVRPPYAPAKDAGPKRKLDENTYYYEDEETGNWTVQRYNPQSKMFMTVDSSVKREGLPAMERLVDRMERESPKPDECIFEILDYVVEKMGDEKYITEDIVAIAIPLDPPWLMATITRPDLVCRYLDAQLKHTKELIKALKAHGVDFILGGGDLADNRGPLYSPKVFRKIVLPRLRALISYCHELGLPYIYRTDGNIWPIAKELFVESGADGYGEIDAQAGMNIGEIKRRLPHLVLWGNVDCAKTLPFGPEEKIIAETRRCIEEGGPGGGYILGSSNTIHPNVPAANFLTMLKTARKYGSYPISPR